MIYKVHCDGKIDEYTSVKAAAKDANVKPETIQNALTHGTPVRCCLYLTERPKTEYGDCECKKALRKKLRKGKGTLPNVDAFDTMCELYMISDEPCDAWARYRAYKIAKLPSEYERDYFMARWRRAEGKEDKLLALDCLLGIKKSQFIALNILKEESGKSSAGTRFTGENKEFWRT